MRRSDELCAAIMENVKLQRELDECRKHLAESVCRECKCKVNTSVNHDLVKENLRLRKELGEK